MLSLIFRIVKALDETVKLYLLYEFALSEVAMLLLYKKYQVTNYENLPAINPLSFILRKAELAYELTESEWAWLKKYQFIETIDIIKNQENYRNLLQQEIKREIIHLKRNQFLYYSINTIPRTDSEIAFILYKVNAQERLFDTELRFVGQGYHRFLDFNDKKQKYGITESFSFDDDSEVLLEKLDKKYLFTAKDIEWLCIHNAYSFLTLLKNQFSQLQRKYKATVHNDFNGDKLKLFHILQKLEEKTLLNEIETNFLNENGFTEVFEIIQKIEFSTLKIKYHATQTQEEDIKSHLFKVLKKLDTNLSLPEQDINYLKKRKLFETIKFTYKKHADSLINKIKQNQGLRPDDVAWCEEYDFKGIVLIWLKKDYVIEHRKDTPESPLYLILKKLQASNRLTDDEVIWLETEKLLNSTNKIYLSHHLLEAQFNENEFQRTKDYWKLANASAHWRKAAKPLAALKQTDKLNYKQIKPAKLRAALLTTRGGALRDTNEFYEAELCALEAINHFSESHNPYTLLGALCYDTRRYDEGDKWFEEAIKRGAQPRDQDAEIRSIIRKKKGKELQELIDHLLKKDPLRFAWVKK